MDPIVILTAEDLAARYPRKTRASTPLNDQIHADAVQSRYYQNTRATTSRLAAETRSEFDSVRRAALLRLVRRLGFETARDVWRLEWSVAYKVVPKDFRFRLDCQLAAGAILAGVPR